MCYRHAIGHAISDRAADAFRCGPAVRFASTGIFRPADRCASAFRLGCGNGVILAVRRRHPVAGALAPHPADFVTDDAGFRQHGDRPLQVELDHLGREQCGLRHAVEPKQQSILRHGQDGFAYAIARLAQLRQVLVRDGDSDRVFADFFEHNRDIAGEESVPLIHPHKAWALVAAPLRIKKQAAQKQPAQ